MEEQINPSEETKAEVVVNNDVVTDGESREVKTEEEQPNKVLAIAGWIIGVIIIFLGIFYIIEDPLYAIFMLLLGLLCFPISRRLIRKYVKDPYRLPVIIGLAIVFIIGVFLTA